jgi:hypothetical protein
MVGRMEGGREGGLTCCRRESSLVPPPSASMIKARPRAVARALREGQTPAWREVGRDERSGGRKEGGREGRREGGREGTYLGRRVIDHGGMSQNPLHQRSRGRGRSSSPPSFLPSLRPSTPCSSTHHGHQWPQLRSKTVVHHG